MAQMNVNDVVAQMGELLGHGVEQEADLARLAVQTLVRLAEQSNEPLNIQVGAATKRVTIFAGHHKTTAYGPLQDTKSA